MIEEFKEFMKFNGWWENYLENFFESDWNNNFEFVTDFLRRTNYDCFLAAAFSWHKTEEGGIFWVKISDDWLDYIEYWGDEIGN